MKRLFAICGVMMLLLTSCSKDKITNGLYYSDTKDGMLYLQLEGGNDCTMFFEGCDENDGYYDIKGNEITLISNASIKINGRTSSWWFGGTLGNGIINGNSFKIQAQRVYTTTPEYLYITFHKH